jgi:hypothetical protein
MGAMEPLRWQSWHFSWKIGTMSFVKVTVCGTVSAAIAIPENVTTAPANARKPRPKELFIACSFLDLP